MPSLTDIPDDLKTPEAKEAFIEWTLELAVNFATARSLVHLWMRLTHTRLSSEEWLRLENKFKGT